MTDHLFRTCLSDYQGITADFRPLRTVLGTSFNPSNSEDVVLPDLRGEFLRGWRDDKTGVDSGKVFGSTQLDEFKSHDHSHQQVL